MSPFNENSQNGWRVCVKVCAFVWIHLLRVYITADVYTVHKSWCVHSFVVPQRWMMALAYKTVASQPYLFDCLMCALNGLSYIWNIWNRQVHIIALDTLVDKLILPPKASNLNECFVDEFPIFIKCYETVTATTTVGAWRLRSTAASSHKSTFHLVIFWNLQLKCGRILCSITRKLYCVITKQLMTHWNVLNSAGKN